MEKKFSDEKAVELIFESLQRLKRGETSFEAFAVGVALIIDPVPLTENDFEWARQTAVSLGLESLLTQRAADECPTCAGLGFVNDNRGRRGVDCSDCNGSGIRR